MVVSVVAKRGKPSPRHPVVIRNLVTYPALSSRPNIPAQGALLEANFGSTVKGEVLET